MSLSLTALKMKMPPRGVTYQVHHVDNLVKILRSDGTNLTHHVDNPGEDIEEGWDKPDSPCR